MNLPLRPKGLLLVAGALVLLSYFLSRPDSYPITNARPAGNTLVCFGDSLTYGTGAAKGMDYPAQLSRLLGEPVVNLGVPGDTTAGALARIDQVLKLEPRLVFLTLGGNDLKNGVAREAAFANLRAIVSQLQQAGALVVIGGIQVPMLGRGFGDAYQRLARETGALLLDNVFDGIMGNASLMSDQIHPNDQGYAILARRFQQLAAPYLK